MPFTPSHAIVALPFIRTPLVPAAIAIGAMAPDLPLFVRVGADYAVLHDVRALAVSTALALVLLLVWRLLLRPAARQLAPRPIAERLPAAWDGSMRDALRETFIGTRTWPVTTLLLLVSLALGVLSHIVWDSFTHEGRGGVSLLPTLDQQWGPLLGYKWLQYGSSVLGVVVLAVWGLLALRRARPVSVVHVVPAWVGVVWVLALPVLLIVVCVWGYLQCGPITAEFTVQHLAYRTLPRACGYWGALTLVLAGVIAVVRR